MTIGTWKKTLREVSFYLVILASFDLLFFCFVKYHKYVNYSDAKFQTLMKERSKSVDVTDDPCKYSLIGDPNTSNFVKIKLTCDSESKLLFTMDLNAIQDKTVVGVIKELGKLNRFAVTVDSDNRFSLGKFLSDDTNKWSCLIDDINVTRLDQAVNPKAVILCKYEKTTLQK